LFTGFSPSRRRDFHRLFTLKGLSLRLAAFGGKTPAEQTTADHFHRSFHSLCCGYPQAASRNPQPASG
jgi:hypothetical protein